jgi:hypothetical protein
VSVYLEITAYQRSGQRTRHSKSSGQPDGGDGQYCRTSLALADLQAFSQLPLIIILIMKNNPISLLTGITYQKLNYVHRAASRVCLMCSWIHALAWTPRVWEASHFSRAYIIWVSVQARCNGLTMRAFWLCLVLQCCGPLAFALSVGSLGSFSSPLTYSVQCTSRHGDIF